MIDADIESWEHIFNNWQVVGDELNRLIKECMGRLAAKTQTPTIEDVRVLQKEIEIYQNLIVLPKRKIDQLIKETRKNGR
jgi:hypothetical protein